MLASPTREQIERNYEAAQVQYKALGVDTDTALARLNETPISLHCWQGDDVRGFEVKEVAVGGGGIMATGNYPGAARNGDELRKDAAKAFSLIPGQLRFNIHAIYAETSGKRVDRDLLTIDHFSKWVEWGKANGVKLDFNTSLFAHPLANSGFTLASADDKVRHFWVRHAIACRRIAEAMGRAQRGPCIINHWVPDGAKDTPVDRWSPRRRLVKSLDEIFAAPVDRDFCRDFVECKLFGIGSEDYVVGSHEFYLGYGAKRGINICLDMGHFHPTETIADKLSAILTFSDSVLLHVSRGVRWDSDHVVLLNDDVKNVFHELVRGHALGKTCIALDFFDASINRIGAWVIGTRCALKGILNALLEPTGMLQEMEAKGDLTAKLAMVEELKTLPLGAVWDMHCLKRDVPVGPAWIDEMKRYETDVLRQR
ncbi:MAG: L-rhamnose isomerase [Lentisphaerae bacterium RIFOXYB12_FULL_65_16]|nr:MAG: L-rhamnose isomerase [Lentisphaerae bacterium RIFOXYA12_64_32]OGV93189.1 MAG: L-rhamnose isomerase [Lentisphaerae bacterium RIFOXYB12_FULL_65_16]